MEPLLPRLAFDFPESLIWVMHCAEGPVPRRAAEALAATMQVELRPWELSWEEDFIGLPRRVKAAGAQLLGSEADDLSLVASTGDGLFRVARGLTWSPGDEVVLPLGEFPANAWPWLALQDRGVQVREIPLWDGHRAGADAWRSTPPPPGVAPEERLIAAVGPRTRVLAVSWVRFQDGLVLDLEQLGAACRQRGVALVVDGVQGAGTRLPALRDVAAFATGGHKALLAPQGLGLLWTAAEFRAELSPPGGWLALQDATRFSRPSTDFQRVFLATGERLEVGVPNLIGAAALLGSLTMLAQIGVERLAQHIAALRAELLERLATTGAWAGDAERLQALDQRGRLGAVVALHHNGAGAEALDALRRRGFERRIYASVREGYLRIALHGYHGSADLARLVEWLETKS